MKSILSLAYLLILSVTPSIAQHQFNCWSYNPPLGWSEKKQANSVLTITAPDNLSLILLLPPKPLTNSLQENFHLGWEEYVRKAFGITASGNGVPQQTGDGLEMVVSGWKGNRDGIPFFMYFYTIKNKSESEYLLVLCEGEAGYKKHQKEIDGFLNTFQFNKQTFSLKSKAESEGFEKSPSHLPDETNAPLSKGNSAASVNTGTVNFKESSPTRVYWALTTQLKMGWSIGGNGSLDYGSTSGNSIGKDLYFLVLFDDAIAYWWSFLPAKGLHQFDRANQSFGLYSYRLSGNGGTIRTSNRDHAFSVTGKELIVDGENYHPLPSVNGLRLDGKWYRSDFETEIKNGTYSFGYLTLTNDGHFSDEGMLEGWASIKPGQGTYEIRDYTLLLTFSDGRKEQLSCFSLQSPVLDRAFINSREISRLR